MPTRHLGPVALLPFLLVALVACGDGQDPDVIADTTGASAPANSSDPSGSSSSEPRGPSSTPEPLPSQTQATSSTAPPPPGPRPCGTVIAPDGTDLSVVILSGADTCDSAETLIDIYHYQPPAPPLGPARFVNIDGWECTTDPEADPGPVVTCVLPGSGAVTAEP